MKMKHTVPLALSLFSGLAIAQDAPLKNIQINGWGFFRHETKKDQDYKASAKDKIDFNQTRINVSVKGDLAENFGYVFFAPQFSKVSGAEYVGNTNTGQASAGTALYDPRLDLHEAYIALRPTQNENLHVFLGRQELAYGDHLIIGSVPWHRIGRAFDGGRVRYKMNDKFTADAFSMKLIENNALAPAPGTRNDTNFHGLYLMGNLGSYMSSVDAYALKKDNLFGSGPTAATTLKDSTTIGLRAKSKLGETAFDYRAEGAVQEVRAPGDSGNSPAHQYSVEVGYTLPFKATRLGVEYFDASKDYDQLFPTAHKFMGYADQFARRNIKGIVGHLSMKPADKWSFFADYHMFRRSNKNNPGYGFAGQSLGTAGNSEDIANELDLVLAYDFTKTVQLSYGISWVTPGDYLKDQSAQNNAETQWSFLQLLVRF